MAYSDHDRGIFPVYLKEKIMLKKIGVVFVTLTPMVSFAAVPAEVTSAITGAGADALVVAGACLVAIIGLLAFKYMRRAAS